MAAKKLSLFKDYAILSLGTLIYCLSWTMFMIPNGVASGGLTGLCTILQLGTGIPVAYSYIVLNAILLTVGFLIMGNGFGIKTIYCILLATLLLDILPRFPFLLAVEGSPLYISERILVPIVGGLVEAIGIAIIFRKGGSTGGTDVVALVVNKFWPVSPGRVFLVVDIFIIASLLLVPGKTFEDVLYGYVAMFTFSVAVDTLTLGAKSTVQVLIFSDKYREVADYITVQLDRGATVVKAMGWYSKADRDILLVLVRKSEVQDITRIVKHIDPRAFMSISPASGVYGEGFEEFKTGVNFSKRTVKREIHQ